MGGPDRRRRRSGPSTSRFTGGDVFGVRVAGAPVSDLEALRCERAWATVCDAVALAAWLRETGAELADSLHPAIGHCPAGTKPLLVALRRAVFAGRRPSGRAWSAVVREALPDELVTRIDHWLRELARSDAMAGLVAGLLAAEGSAAREALWKAARRDAFRFGLAVRSPDLSRAVGRWLDDPAAPPPRRRGIISLTRYLARAVTKPSPYSSFTLSGLGEWADGGPATTTSGDLDWCGLSELDWAAVMGLWQGLSGHPRLADQVALRVNPTVEERGGRLSFLGAAAGEPIVTVARSSALHAAIDFVETEREPTVGTLVRRLSASAPAERARRYVDELLSLGLLERCRPFRDQSADPLEQLAGWVGAHGLPTVARRLIALRAAVRGYPSLTTAAARADRLRLAQGLLDDLFEDTPGAGRPPRRPTIVENAVLPHPVVACSRKHWQPVFEDLNALREFLGVMDDSLPAKLAAGAFFRDRFGPGAELAFPRLYREYHTANGAREYDEAVRSCHAGRRDALAAIYDGDENADGGLWVDPDVLAKLAATWPPYIRAPRSVCCYGQELSDVDGPRLALNIVRTGYGWGITRIEHLLTAAGRTPPPRRPIPSSAELAVAECRAVFGSQLNQRTAAVSCSLDYPRGQYPGGRGEPLSPAGLLVRYDVASGLLMLRDRLGRRVRPLALGMLVELALPPALRFLVNVFGEPQTAFDPARQLAEAGWRAATGGVRHRPRLEIGRVVVARAGWRTLASDIPLREAGRSDAEHLLALALWCDRHGIPPRCFVHTTGRPDSLGKPLYVDLASWFLVSAFRQALATVDADAPVVFEEALPDPAGAPRHGGGRHVTEYVFELSAADLG